MLRKYRVEESGDTNIIPGSLVDRVDLEEENEKAEAMGLRPAKASRALLGITKASLATSSFLSAASFQETTRVLTDAAIKGKIDPLIGLKENIIIGKLIPAGTGIQSYGNIEIEKENAQKEDFDEMFGSDHEMIHGCSHDGPWEDDAADIANDMI